jgi:hypothetical protein
MRRDYLNSGGELQAASVEKTDFRGMSFVKRNIQIFRDIVPCKYYLTFPEGIGASETSVTNVEQGVTS